MPHGTAACTPPAARYLLCATFPSQRHAFPVSPWPCPQHRQVWSHLRDYALEYLGLGLMGQHQTQQLVGGPHGAQAPGPVA